jgi:signal transduction histidine kinase
LHLNVRDDGCGFDPSAHADGFGLLGMSERVELLEGTLQIDSAPGEGTTISAVLPIRERAGGSEHGEGVATRGS